MWRFQYIEYFWLLLILPIAVVSFLIYLRWRRNSIARLGEQKLIMTQLKGRISGRVTTRFVLRSTALLLAIIGLANLQMGAGTESSERKGIDVIFALDVSKSMLAKDIQPDRLTRSKQLIERMMSNMKNNRVGLIVFAGKAYLQSPLTSDYTAIKMLLSSVKPEMVPTPGTVLAQAIQLADTSFSQHEKKYKALVLISDGEDHDEAALAMAEQAAQNGLVIHTVGVGSPEGSTIIDPATGKEKLDENGEPVISKLNEVELQGIAQAANGGYQHLINAHKVADNLATVINDMEGRSMGTVVFTQFKSYYQYFLGLALVLLLIEWLLPVAGRLRANFG
jgi:Ca-activated chloride channel family protein